MIFEQIPRLLRSLLFLCRSDFRLTPENQIELAEDSTAFDWIATGAEPRFKVGIWRPVIGWVLIRVKLVDGFDEEPEVRVDFEASNAGVSHKSMKLTATGYGEYQAIGFLRNRVKNVRFRPSNQAGKFSIREFALYNVPRLSVRRLGLRALSAYHPDFYRDSYPKVLTKLLERKALKQIDMDSQLEEYVSSLIKSDDRVTYDAWIRRVEKREVERLKTKSKKLAITRPHAPMITILLVVDNASAVFLKECLQSITTQTYPNWELCVAVDNPSILVKELIGGCCQGSNRIREIYNDSFEELSDALNAVLKMSRGEYVVFLNPKDKLAQYALLSIAEALERSPRPRILYSDNDEIDAYGRRHSPHFKCDWNPDLLYSQNYISNLVVYETDLIRSVGCLKRGFPGNEGYEVLLRASANINRRQIHHIPLILYHERQAAKSQNDRKQSRESAYSSGVRVLQSFFDDRGDSVQVEPGHVPFTYRPRWPIPDPLPLVSIIIPTRDNLDLLKECISSLLELTNYTNFEVLVVDNDSRESSTLDYLTHIANHNSIRLLRYPGKFNYAALNNFAVVKATGKVICLLNDDVKVIEPDWLIEMVSHASRPDIGCVGAKLLYPDRRIQHAGVICGIRDVAGHSHKYLKQEESGYFYRPLAIQNLSAVTAACLVVKRPVWCAVNGMNSNHLAIAFNDVDLCLRVQTLGLRNLWTPYAKLIHHESGSRDPELCAKRKHQFRNEMFFMKNTWGNYLSKDPYYNPHLTLKGDDFAIRACNLSDLKDHGRSM